MLRFYFCVLAAIGILAGCKNSKPYHNLTGRYNAYYNAGLRITGAFESLNGGHRDNYNQILPLYPYIAAGADGVKAPLEEAITKCAKNIELHRISNWVDDTYLYLGQAEFLKKDYEKSAATFKYIVDFYNPDKPKSAMTKEELEKLREQKKKDSKKKKKKKSTKKKKKKKKKPTPKPSPDKEDGNDKDKDGEGEEKPKKYGLKHRPNRHQAMLWLAKAYVETKQYDDARLYLRLLENDGTVPFRLRGEVQAVMAHSFIAQKDYTKAIPALELAVERTKKKRVKNRYAYVLAQLYQQQGNSEMAMENFRKVLKLRPDYEMEFNARLNMAKNAADVKGGTEVNPEMAIRRMIRDGKNEEYKDQLYFALAEIQLKSGNTEEGIKSLQQSMAKSSGGPQRGEASLLLADLYYERGDYVRAFNYYDTASTSLDKTDERVENITMRRKQLEPIATSIQTITLQDSLLKIGNLTYEEQKAWAQRVRKEELEAKKNATTGGKGSSGGKASSFKDDNKMGVSGNTTSVSQNAINQSTFELYNPITKKKGEKDFERRWGDRAWADNWRVSSQSANNSVAEDGKGGELQPMTEDEIKKFLQNKKVPTTDTDKKRTEDEIAAAYYKLGSAYREELRNNDLAANAFKTITEKYPNSKQDLEALFALYGIAKEQNNNSQAETYKQKILSKYPTSDIAKALTDPNFVGAKEQQIASLNKYYEDVRKMVEQRKFTEAREQIKTVPTKFTENPLKARFAILEAMCVGGTEGLEPYVKALKAVSVSYPKTPEDEQARKMVAVLTGTKVDNNTSKPNTNTTATENTEFDKTEEVGHYVIVLFDDTKVKVDNYKNTITDFNTRHYSSAKLSVSPLLIDREIPALVVRKFKNMQTAKEYCDHATNSTVLGSEAPKHKFYYVGQKNYQGILQKNNFKSSYVPFFDTELNK